MKNKALITVVTMTGLAFLIFLTNPVAAALISDPNSIDLYPNNSTTSIWENWPPRGGSSPEREGAWLAALLDMDPDEIVFSSKDEFSPSATLNAADTFSGYAVVKFGQNWAAFVNDFDYTRYVDGSLSNIEGITNVSHITYFNADTAAPVPEPATILLLGAGLIGVAVFASRKRYKYKE